MVTLGHRHEKKIKARIIPECNSSRVTFSYDVKTPSEFKKDVLKFVEERRIKLEKDTK